MAGTLNFDIIATSVAHGEQWKAHNECVVRVSGRYDGEMSKPIEVPVLVAGGSLVGLSSALFLGHYGARSLVVERHRGTAIHPRAAQISQRTMEIFRAMGIEQTIRQKSEEQFVQDGAIMAVETLAGKEIAWYVANLNEGITDVSPTIRVFVTQSLLEPLLKNSAASCASARN